MKDTEKRAATAAGGYNGWHLLAVDIDTGEVRMESV
jgi:hypothetical protein